MTDRLHELLREIAANPERAKRVDKIEQELLRNQNRVCNDTDQLVLQRAIDTQQCPRCGAKLRTDAFDDGEVDGVTYWDIRYSCENSACHWETWSEY